MSTNSYKLLLFLAGLLISGCRKEKIDFTDNAEIRGKIEILNPQTKILQELPKNASATVFFNGSEFMISSFKTSSSGLYAYKPQSKGTYLLKFNFADTLIQYDAALREKKDLDSLRRNEYKILNYSGESSSVEIGKSGIQRVENVTLSAKSTVLSLLVVDELNNPISRAKVSLFSSKAAAESNAPNAGGAIAFLTTNESGLVSFIGLEARRYYINIRANLGILVLTNQWSDSMKFSNLLAPDELNKQTITLR